MTEQFLASTAPVFKVDGETRGGLGRDLLRLEVEEGTEGLKALCAHFIAVGPAGGEAESQLYLDGSVVDFGKKLEVSMGPPDAERIVFKGVISGIEASFEEAEAPVVALFAEDTLMKLRMTRRMKTYENMSDADIAQAIATEHGLTAEADVDGPTHDVVQQWNMSDLAFLRERAERVQAEIWIEEDKLFFKGRTKRAGTEITLVKGNHLLSVQVRADLSHQRTKVKVSGYDAEARDVIDEEAGNDAVQAEITSGKTGPSVLERALGERVSFRVRDVPLTAGEATAWARAEMLRRARMFVTAVGTTRGTPDMVVGSKLTLQGVGAPFEGGGYIATRVRHTYDLTLGHRTHFHAERPTLNEAP